MNEETNLTHAKMAPSFVHAPGLFRCLPKGEQQKLKLNITYVIKGKAQQTYKFWGSEPLNALDLLVLQGLVAIATARFGQHGRKCVVGDGVFQKEGLALEGGAAFQETMAARFKLCTLLRHFGYKRPSGDTLIRFRNSIERLSAVTVLITSSYFRGAYRLLSGYQLDMETGEVVVCLSPKLTAAVLGTKGYLRVDLSEVRRLKSDAARLIHGRLHWINAGLSGNVGLDALVDYAYGGDGESKRTTRLKREAAVRKALDELRKLAWTVAETKDKTKNVVFTISRPLVKTHRRPNGDT
ncbi:replication protein C, IncQ-type [Alcaligenes faecalis]|uniref:Replication protein n=1 Tax=Alcaligenes faecalis TaxID=511 RepID=A0AAE9KN33_ALCFA|nr:replication protein C, IncQ-type [Alcaligenes faecalis]UPL21018.1 replication protein [Alcaligenes faecalis]